MNELENPYRTPAVLAQQPIEEVADREPLSVLRLMGSIWIHPRKTIRKIVDSDPNYYFAVFAILSGLFYVQSHAIATNLGDHWPFEAIIMLVCFLGPVMGLILAWLHAFALERVGTWIDGKGNRSQLRAVYAWSSVPLLGMLLMSALETMILGMEEYTSKTPYLDSSPELMPLLLGILVINVVLMIWSFVIYFGAITEVQKFSSYAKTAANVFLAFVLLLMAVLVCMLLFLVVIAFLLPVR